MTGVLARRGYNVQSLAVGNCEKAGLSRITTVIPGSKESSVKIIKQLYKLIHVHSVTDLSDVPFITRELMLVKCRCKPHERKELIDLANIFHGNICDVSRITITLEVQGKEDKMRAVQNLLEPYGMTPFMTLGMTVTWLQHSETDGQVQDWCSADRHCNTCCINVTCRLK